MLLSARLEICRLPASPMVVWVLGHGLQWRSAIGEVGNLHISGMLPLRVARMGVQSAPKQRPQTSFRMQLMPHAMRAMVLWIKLCGRRGAFGL